MSSKIDWGDLEPVSESKIDWGDLQPTDPKVRPNKGPEMRRNFGRYAKSVASQVFGLPGDFVSSIARGANWAAETFPGGKPKSEEELDEIVNNPLTSRALAGQIEKIFPSTIPRTEGEAEDEEILGTLVALLTPIPGGAASKASKAGKLGKGLFQAEKLPSGLTKPAAVGASKPQWATISKGSREKALTKLNEEAAQLARKEVHEAIPVAKEIEKGVDFEAQFGKRFEQLQNMASKANPEIDISPISKLLSETAKKYRGIPKLHPDAEKVMREIKALSSRPQTGLRNLLKIYRSNNQKIKGIDETSRLLGKRHEYTNFLGDINRAIGESVERTLGSDSAWVKEFKQLNSEFRQYKRAQDSLRNLDHLLGGRASSTTLQRYAKDPKMQRRLASNMGEKAAGQIKQISEDLDLARRAVKKIPVKDLHLLDKVLPLGFAIPGGQIPTALISAVKAPAYLRRGYGLLLTTSARRAAYSEFLRSITSGNKESYMKAAAKLAALMKPENEEKEEID